MPLVLALMFLRVATYNVHSCRGLDLRMKPDRIARVIQHTRADVIALEEVRFEQAEAIARQLGLAHVFGLADILGGHPFGNAILSRRPITAWRNYPIGAPRREQRAVIRADIDLPGAALLHVFGVHLGLSGNERRAQTARLLSPEILGDPELSGPKILLGDFNELCNRGPVNRAIIAVMRRKNKRTYPGLLPLFPVDRVYFGPRLSVRAMRVDRCWRALIASDHAPLIADIEIADAAPGINPAQDR
ncbi:MAG TPA: endonuclease/exonuclease/phosphatase family protein [Bryobacteraceae bacterium]|jgi:endonuclease/exonuclease/phosphatase family metal-dependent hydrolase|nr:endonuclease/exonuclease/phosphatase family protein [Bryobacteraceae bacterium]